MVNMRLRSDAMSSILSSLCQGTATLAYVTVVLGNRATYASPSEAPALRQRR